MFGQTRWSPIEDMFNFQREADRLFNELWNESRTYPARPAQVANPNPFQVHTSEDNWRLEIPCPASIRRMCRLRSPAARFASTPSRTAAGTTANSGRPDHCRAAIPGSGPRERDASARPARADAAAEGQCQAAAHSDRRRRRVTEAVDHRVTGTRRTGRTSAGPCAALRGAKHQPSTRRSADARDRPLVDRRGARSARRLHQYERQREAARRVP